MNLAKLFWKLLRYRVAAMLLLFLLLGAAINGEITHHPWPLLIATFSLAFSYVSATSSNDLADEKIDLINHPNSIGRPLITGNARSRDMWLMFGLSSLAAILLCSFISFKATGVVCVSILLNIIYSLKPFRLSYRTFLAPLVLGVAYVWVPFILAVTVTKSRLVRSDFVWIIGLYLMFIGRILLKDFRDRKGDAKYNKPTFLLKFGKNATCLISSIFLIIGGILIILQLHNQAWLAVIAACYIVSILYMLLRLSKAEVGHPEQISIGVAAKMGNGLLITLLCAFALQGTSASTGSRIVISLFLTALFFSNYFIFLSNPDKSVIGYKG